MQKRNHNPKLGKIVEVVWMDAVGEQKKCLEDIKNIPPSQLLVLTKTYGEFYKEDDKAIMILQERSEEEVDLTVIPTAWVIKINIMKGGKK